LINNRSYSDAEIFPNAFRTLGLGKLVGQPTGGFVIGTSSSRLIDGSLFRVPRTGIFTLKGVNMEKEGVVPDLLVEADPDQWARGDDQQLVKAVRLLSTDVAALKSKGSWSMSSPWVGGFAWPDLVPSPTNVPPPTQNPMTTSKQ
jgi:tricorn protease